MLILFLACTVGAPGPASPGSASNVEAQAMNDVAQTAGRLANKARELEAASVSAIDAEERAERLRELDTIMLEIEALNATLQSGHEGLEGRIRAAAQPESIQSTDDTRE